MERLLRVGEKRIVRKLESIARQVNSIEDDFVAMSDDELRALTAQYKERVANGESLDELLAEAFATVREAARRIEDEGWDARNVFGQFLAFGRDALHLALGGAPSSVDLPEEEAQALAKIAEAAKGQ